MMDLKQATEFLAAKLPRFLDFSVEQSGHRQRESFLVRARVCVLMRGSRVETEADFAVKGDDFEPAARAALDHVGNYLIREAEREAATPLISGDIPF